MFNFITYAERGRCAEIKINKPPYNVLDIACMDEINQALLTVKKNEANLNCLVIKSEGEKAFSAGVDVADHTGDKMQKMIDSFHGIFRKLESLSILTISAVKGSALGGGCELALGCDLILAADNAKFGQPEIKLAVFPPIAITYLAPIVGVKRAFEIVMLGEVYSAIESKNMGLVNQVYPLADFDKEADTYIGKIEKLSGSALKATKKALKKALNLGFDETLKVVETLYLNELMVLEDANEGINSFMEKRKPVWKHN